MLTARLAVLVSEFKLPLRDYWELTPRQVEEIYFHPRDDKGAIKPPAQPRTFGRSATCDSAALLFASALIPPNQLAAIIQQMKESKP